MDIHVHAARHDVFPPGGFRVEPDAGGQQRRHPPVGMDAAARRRVDPGEHLEQCALAGTVGADDAEPIAVFDVEGDVAERLHGDTITRVARQIADAGRVE